MGLRQSFREHYTSLKSRREIDVREVRVQPGKMAVDVKGDPKRAS